jgi:PleD family two-component response regulator
MEDLNMKKKILVIDDDETSLTMTKNMLEENYDVTTVTSGTAAFDLIKKGFIPNLVLLDMYMPEMGGWNTLLKIRKLCESHKVHIAIYSSSEDPDGMAKAKEFGAVEYLHKPLSRTKLNEKVEQMLNL